jgi:hypothetical protein
MSSLDRMREDKSRTIPKMMAAGGRFYKTFVAIIAPAK